MARIPDARSIKEKDINVMTPIATVDVSQVGRGLETVGRALDERQKLINQNEYNKAKVKFDTEYTKLMNSFKGRTDYKQFDADYAQGFEQSRDAAASLIEDPKLREQFIQEATLRGNDGMSRVSDLRLAQEKDTERGDLFNNLNTLTRTAVDAPDADLSSIIDTTVQTLDTAVALGYISRQERAKKLEDWKGNVALMRIEAMDPEDRIKALDTTYADMIPIEKREQLRRDAEDEKVESKAIDIVDEYLGSGLDRTEAAEQIRKINDDTLRLTVESRFDYEYAKKERAEVESQKQIYDEFFDPIQTGSMGVSDIPDEQWRQLSSAAKSNLLQLEYNAVKPRATSDGDALIQLAIMKANKDWEGIAKFTSENSNLLSVSDRQKYAQIALDGSMPPEVDDGLTDVQYTNGRLAKADITDKKAKDLILNEIGEWRRKYIQRTGKSPDDAERDTYVDKLLIETATGTGWFDGSERVYEMDDDDWEGALESMKERDPDALSKVQQYYANKGYEPTRAEIVDTFNKMTGK